MSEVDLAAGPEQQREETSRGNDDTFPVADYQVSPKKKRKNRNKNKAVSLIRKTLPRIEACIQRYRAKRKFDSHRRDLFDKYLGLGGIETGPKMFGGGLDANATDDMDAQEIATITATDYVGKDKFSTGVPGQHYSDWVVDFESIAKGYFSHKIPTCFDITDPKEIKLCTSTVRNFLNYILHHNVCPEYNDQVYAARAICDLAERELAAVVAVSRKLQGDFNTACSTLFGGYYKGLYVGDQEWAKDMCLTVGMSDERAKKIVNAGLAAMGSPEQFQQAKEGGLRVVKEENIGLEVTEILRPDEETREFYKCTLLGDLKCLGKLKGRRWVNPAWLEEDESEDEEERPTECLDEYEFWVEEDALEHLIVGMKLELVVRLLNCGVTYFDTVFDVHCSFFTYLENERMSSYKGIGDVDGQTDAGFDENIEASGESNL
ncbi:hypothetical protein GP486_000028 [Trichoglossum hirsutum]|uniref:Argonaute complex, subunit Arb1 n=1 Tax=Trichoglossum hirsutum TaxID=265104 RepID=A0A9P8RUB9_9PEZI|nr:hypothetical protein GP486_000028 [Trichoglossum hirsutum]